MAVTVVGGLILAAILGVISSRRRKKRVSPLPPPLTPPETSGPDLRILDLEPTGGGGTYVDFRASVANYGTQQCRCELSGFVGDEPVECQPRVLDLLANTPPQSVRVLVPRPQLGELVPAFNNETTLYGKALRVEAVAGDYRVSKQWQEVIYTLEENYQRHHIQQRVWRFGRGEETESDVRQEHLEETIRRRGEKFQRGPDYDWNG